MTASSPNHTPSETRIPTGDIVVSVFGRTDVGRAREHNEDAFAVADLTSGDVPQPEDTITYAPGDRGALFMVADGMGGAASGELASAMAIDVVLDELRSRWCEASTFDGETFASALKEATEVANERIHAFATEHTENRGMGTTATVAGLLGDTLFLAQVGDSRAYLVRGGAAIQLTKDQSLMQRLIEAGEITEEEAEVSERRNIILQALGPEAYVKIDLTHQAVRRGDTLVLCSDGLSGQVRAEEIARVVAQEEDPASACDRLIDMANETGGPDNITVIVARFDGPGLDAAGLDDEIGHRVFPMAGDDTTPVAPMERYFHRSGAVPAIRRPASGGSPDVAVAGAPGGTPPRPRESRRAYMFALAFAVVVAIVYFVLTVLLR